MNNQYENIVDIDISKKLVSNALLKLFDKLSITNIAPFGYSMGAWIALYLGMLL